MNENFVAEDVRTLEFDFGAKVEDAVVIHNALPLGEFYHPAYGKIEITKELIEQMERNFKNGLPPYKIPVNISHNDMQGAYGYVEDLKAKDDGLYITFRLTDEGYELVRKERFKYLSAEFTEHYQDPNTGNDVGAVFLGVALTLRPAHPKMKPIKLSELFNSFVKWLGLKIKSEDVQEEVELGITAVPKGWKLNDTSSWDWDWKRDADKIIKNHGWATLAKACVYVDTENYEKGPSGYPEVKEAYTLPYAKDVNGQMTIFWSGVKAAMQVLLGARGGVKKIPQSKKRAAYNKLVKLYKLFGKEPPEFHLVREEETMDMDLVKQLEERDVKIKELEARVAELEKQLLDAKLEAYKTQKVGEGYPPAVVEKLLEHVKAGSLNFEAVDAILDSVGKVDLEQKYEAGTKKQVDITEEAKQDAKKFGYLKEEDTGGELNA